MPFSPTRHVDSPRRLHRRTFLKKSALTIVAAFAPLPVFAGFERLLQDVRKLTFYNLHTEETLKVCYCRGGAYDGQALKAVNHILRDHRSNEIHPIDTRLLDLLHAISLQVESRRFHVISGYRSPSTNAKLRRDGNGVASRSLHMCGQAIDIRIPGVESQRLHRVAVDLKGGGVGHYPRLDFVHVDVGRVRYW